MTIDQAIELLRRDIDNPGSADIQDLNEAEQLGIEALKRVKDAREVGGYGSWYFLKGETES